MSRVTRISTVLHEAIGHGVFPGAVLFVRCQGKVFYHEGAGVKGMAPFNQPVTINTIYDLASLTKPLATTAAVLRLIQEGRLRFEQTIAEWVDELRDSPFGASTIRQVLNHSAGFPAWRPYYECLAPEARKPEHETERQARIQTCLSYIAGESLEYGPGSKSVYSDLGFIVLGLIAERSTRENLAAYCRGHIFQPLQATTCSYLAGDDGCIDYACIAPTEDDEWRGRVVHGEVHDDNAYALGGMTGHAGLFGTAESVSRVTREWLLGVHGHSTILSSELIRECVRRQDATGQSSWALGWDTPSASSSSGKHFSDQSFGHLGYTGTSIWIDPLRDLEVIFLSNRVHPTRENNKIREFRPYLHDVISEEVAKGN